MREPSNENDRQLREFARASGLENVEELKRFPKYFAVETVSLCNARCVMCPVDQWERSVRHMAPEVFDKILREMTPFGQWINQVALFLNGEPLIDKHLEERIRVLKDIGVKFVMFTCNASLMTEARAESILRAGIDGVDFSVDGATAETFEAIRKRLKFDECIANIETFIRVRNRLHPNARIRIRMTVQEKNAGEFEQYLTFWRSRLGPKDSAYGKLLHNWGAWLKEHALPSEADGARLNASPCISPWGTMVILSDGRVPLCCLDYNAEMPMGDVTTQTIQEIWQSPPFAGVRESHRLKGRASVKMCVDCNAWDAGAKVDPFHRNGSGSSP